MKSNLGNLLCDIYFFIIIFYNKYFYCAIKFKLFKVSLENNTIRRQSILNSYIILITFCVWCMFKLFNNLKIHQII